MPCECAPLVQSFFDVYYAGAPTVARVSSFFFSFVSLEVSLFSNIFVTFIAVSSLCTENTSYVFPFRMVFSYLVTMGWIFLHRLINQSVSQSIKQ